MTRPMPKATRWAIVESYTGRRRQLAQAVHAQISFYESHPGYGIAWETWTSDTCHRLVLSPHETWETAPQCLCEEDWMVDLYWAMVSNDAMLPDYDFSHAQRGPVRPPATPAMAREELA